MEKQIIAKLKLSFDEIVHKTEDGTEFWYARELQELLGYTKWRNFSAAIEKAKISCENGGNKPSDHFVYANKMVGIGSGAQREVVDIMLSRYACYLIAQNGDPRKNWQRVH